MAFSARIDRINVNGLFHIYGKFSVSLSVGVKLMLTRNTTGCNNRDGFLHLSLALQISIFSVAYM